MKPLDPAFNRAVIAMSRFYLPNGFDISENAPSTLQTLTDSFQSGRLTVYSGGSGRTIYGSPEVNYHFRAWHDFCHYIEQYPFSPQGEYSVWALQCNQLKNYFGDTSEVHRWCRIMYAEVIGQQQYEAKHGYFPDDQLTFVKNYLKGFHDGYEHVRHIVGNNGDTDGERTYSVTADTEAR